MKDESNRPRRIDPCLKQAVLHPKRLEILRFLMREPNGTSGLELVKAIDLPLQQVAYHLNLLHDCGLVARVETRRKPEDAGDVYVVAGSRRRRSRRLGSAAT